MGIYNVAIKNPDEFAPYPSGYALMRLEIPHTGTRRGVKAALEIKAAMLDGAGALSVALWATHVIHGRWGEAAALGR